jgi:PD-(D/E)XK endonuclease
MTLQDAERGPVIAPRDSPTMTPPTGPDGDPAGVVDEGVGDDAGGLVEVGARQLPDVTSIDVHWRRQGDLGELSAMEWFASTGAKIYVPVGHSPDCDFVAEADGRLLRVQVKTSTCHRNGRWEVTLATRGGNQSWSGLTKTLDPDRCDRLFVLVGDGRRWCIPSKAVGGSSGVLLGGPKYESFEVEGGRPLPPRVRRGSASTIDASTPRGDVRAAKGAWL